jgi:hypothetical protein
MTEAQILLRFMDWVERFDTRTQAAKRLGCSAQYVGKILSRQAPIPDWVLPELKVKRVVIYEEA